MDPSHITFSPYRSGKKPPKVRCWPTSPWLGQGVPHAARRWRPAAALAALDVKCCPWPAARTSQNACACRCRLPASCRRSVTAMHGPSRSDSGPTPGSALDVAMSSAKPLRCRCPLLTPPSSRVRAGRRAARLRTVHGLAPVLGRGSPDADESSRAAVVVVLAARKDSSRTKRLAE
jgi:hypothetical protein